MEFIEAPMATAIIAEYMKDDEYRALQSFLAGNPKPAMSSQGPVAVASCHGPIGVEARASVVASE